MPSTKRARLSARASSPAPPETPSPTKPSPSATARRPPLARGSSGASCPDEARHEYFGDVLVSDALSHIAASDATLARVVAASGPLPRFAECQRARLARHEPNRAFRALARAIVFQQLNGKAASTIFARVRACVGAEDDLARLTPDAVLAADEDAMRRCGLSARKLEYLRGLADAFGGGGAEVPKGKVSGARGGRFPTLSDEVLESASDAETYDALVRLRGVGPWSVHMFQMFYLNRPDVLPTGDFGVRKGMMRLYGLSAMPTPEKMEAIAAKWAPYRTLASMFMWKVADEANLQAQTPRGEASTDADGRSAGDGERAKKKKRA